MLRFLTAGESHGKSLVAILEGMPAGLKISEAKINAELRRRKEGAGRGPRMKIELDKVKILSGVRKGKTIASPIALLIENKDTSIDRLASKIAPRPGHADLAGCLKYGFSSVNDVWERASARETAARVAVGAVCKILLSEFKIKIQSRVLSIGGETTIAGIKKVIEIAKDEKDTLGGIFEVKVVNPPVGLGSYVHFDRRLDAKIAASCMSIPGVKAIEIGLGFGYAYRFGSEAHDPILYSKAKGLYHTSNNAGGIEGGITNGEDIVLRCCMKPISTLVSPLESVNINTKRRARASVFRSDICVVEAAGVVAESMVGFEVAAAFLDRFGSDSIAQIRKSVKCS